MKKIILSFLAIFMITNTTLIYSLSDKEYEQYNKNNSSLITDSVVWIKADNNGGVWFATYGGGAVYIDNLDNWTLYKKEVNKLKNNYLNCVVADLEGNIYFGTNEGVSLLTKEGNWKNYELNDNKIYGGIINCMAVDNEGGIWHGVKDYGAYYKDNTGIIARYKAQDDEVPSNNVTSIDPDNNGGVWFATNGTYQYIGGIAYLDKNGNWTKYNTSNSKLPSNNVNDIFVSSDGAIWAGTVNGLAKFFNNEWTIYSTNSYIDYNVKSITEDKDGNIYAATWGHGILKINKEGELTVFNSYNSPVPNNYIYSIDFDINNNLWIGTNLGITVIRDKKKSTNATVSEQKKVTVYLNEQLLEFDVSPIIIEGTTLVPVRTLLEALGQEVDWDADKKKVTSIGAKTLELIIDNSVGLIDGKESTMNVPPKTIDGKTLVPLRWISEALGFTVKWDGENYRIDIIG